MKLFNSLIIKTGKWKLKLIVFLSAFILINLILLNTNFVFSQELKVTLEHPFLVNNEWIPAKELSIGDELKTLSGENMVITKITKIVPSETVKVYNLEAGVYHNFVVDNVVVHNSNRPQSYSEVSMRPIDEVGGYSPAERLDYARKVLGEDFVNAESNIPGKTNGDIIMEAHEAKDLQKKYDILMDGLSRQEEDPITSKQKIAELFKRNICGDGLSDEFGLKNAAAARDRERYINLRNAARVENPSLRPHKAIGAVHVDDDFLEASKFFRAHPELYRDSSRACLLTSLNDVYDMNMLVDRTGNIVLRDSQGNLIQGSFFALVLEDGHTYISRNLDSILKLYPFEISSKKRLTIPLCVDSLVQVVFKDGRAVMPILPAKNTFGYRLEFSSAFGILLDSIFGN